MGKMKNTYKILVRKLGRHRYILEDNIKWTQNEYDKQLCTGPNCLRTGWILVNTEINLWFSLKVGNFNI
jgi:hypothetical protein